MPKGGSTIAVTTVYTTRFLCYSYGNANYIEVLMKKIQSYIIALPFVLVGALACVSCKSTEPAQNQSQRDVYAAQTSGTQIQIPKADSDAAGSAAQKNKGNAFVNFFTGGQQDIEIDMTRVFQKTAFGTLKEEDALCIYNIETGLSGFAAWYRGGMYHVLLNKAGRSLFREAVDRYLDDFENKRLDRKGSHTKEYGEHPVSLQWGSFATMIGNRARSRVQFGYEFKDGSPYFLLSVPSAENEQYNTGHSKIAASATLRFYFTKAMTSQMMDALSEENIDAAIAPYMQRVQSTDKKPAHDEY